jgi:hypothetical protein
MGSWSPSWRHRTSFEIVRNDYALWLTCSKRVSFRVIDGLRLLATGDLGRLLAFYSIRNAREGSHYSLLRICSLYSFPIIPSIYRSRSRCHPVQPKPSIPRRYCFRSHRQEGTLLVCPHRHGSQKRFVPCPYRISMYLAWVELACDAVATHHASSYMRRTTNFMPGCNESSSGKAAV